MIVNAKVGDLTREALQQCKSGMNVGFRVEYLHKNRARDRHPQPNLLSYKCKGTNMEDSEVLFSGKIYTQYFQVALFDADVKDAYPQWKTGEEIIVFGLRGVVVATANDTEVSVMVTTGKANPNYKLCVSGEILVGNKGIIVGNVAASSISHIPLQSGEYSVVVYTDGLGPETHQVYFCINRLI